MVEQNVIPHFLAQTATYLPLTDQIIVQQALEMATAVHAGYFRKDSAPYLHHVVEVATILAEWYAPADVLAAGLLHDVHKEQYGRSPTPKTIQDTFGDYIANLVYEASRLGRFGYMPTLRENTPAGPHTTERLPWVAAVLQRCPLSVVIKIADRLHNFRSLHTLSADRRATYAESTLNIFVPFAERLGMRQAKRILEDSAFQTLQPDKYQRLMRRFSNQETAVAPFVTILQEHLHGVGLSVPVTVQSHSLYGLYELEKNLGKPIPPQQASPLLVIAENSMQCYHILGLIHQLWQPHAFEDFIGLPKLNGYRALHTRVRHPNGDILLVIIRDQWMQWVAEYGITARWRGVPESLLPQFPAWQEPPDGKIVVFTPTGDVHLLPEAATPVDFAYAVHDQLGHQCTGAIVNGRMSPLDHPLESGDVVRILTSHASLGPSSEWLHIVKTRRARRAIRHWIQTQKPEEAANAGREMVDKQLRQEGKTLSSLQGEERLEKIASELGYATSRDLLMALGLRRMTLPALLQQLHQAGGEPFLPDARLISFEQSSLLHRLASCCHPLPSDSIVGHITSRQQIIIHRTDCRYVRRIRQVIPAIWTVTPLPPETKSHQWEGQRPITSYDATSPGLIERPYTLKPVSGAGFYGRWQEMSELLDNLRSTRPGQAVLLWGPRRIGKTSLLLHFKESVGQDYLPVFLDLQRLSGRSTTMFLLEILQGIVQALNDPKVNTPSLSRMKKDPLGFFGRFLDHLPALKERHLVLILDEFQLVGELQEEGVTLADINHYFRSLIQHRHGLSIIFSGGGLLPMLLARPSTTFLLEVVRQQKLGCLDEMAARRLIIEPAQQVIYEETAVSRLLELTACHPYYLQWLCDELLDRANREHRGVIGRFHIEELVQHWVPDQGEQFFSHLWGSSMGFPPEMERQNKVVLTTIAHESLLDRKMTLPQLADGTLKTCFSRSDLRKVLNNLKEMDTLAFDKTGAFRIRVSLFHQWLRANYTVEMILGE